HFLCLVLRLPPCSTLFPYTTLFRSFYQLSTQSIVQAAHPAAGSTTTRPNAANRGSGLMARFFRAGRWGTPLLPRRSLQPFTAKLDRKSTRLNSSHVKISYAVFCLKK